MSAAARASLPTAAAQALVPDVSARYGWVHILVEHIVANSVRVDTSDTDFYPSLPRPVHHPRPTRPPENGPLADGFNRGQNDAQKRALMDTRNGLKIARKVLETGGNN